ncbi:MAG: 3-dehydroquinate synthase [Lysobacterales bacterium]
MTGASIVEVPLDTGAYVVRIGRGLLADATLWPPLAGDGAVLVVTDERVAPLYLDRLRNALGASAQATLILPEGERHKTLGSVIRVFDALATHHAGRDAVVVALGGGVIGDLAGFAAACWMRGIAIVQAPTTLLAMVDAAIGGKTGVDMPAGKNLVGAFHQPRMVIADLATLDTLDGRDYRCGLAEVVKYAAIGNRPFFEWLDAHAGGLLARDPGALCIAVSESCRHKARVVAQDEREHGERALLNFGHTLGHALEAAGGYVRWRHGEAVAIGMVMAARLSERLGLASGADADRLVALLAKLGLPIEWPADVDVEAVLASLRFDKKSRAGRLQFVLWNGIGSARLPEEVPVEAVLAAIRAPL